MVYNDDYAGPVLHVRPGELLSIRLDNRLREPTNLHFHGIQTSPQGNSDNVHVSIAPGDRFHYLIRIPAGQPPGLYWYHAHVHGAAEKQIMRGLSGALVVEGFTRVFPELSGVTERLLVLKEYEFDDSGDPVIEDEWHDRIQTINGQTGLAVPMRPRETQVWHLVNQAANRYFHLSLTGHRFRILAEDGVARTGGLEAETLHIAPAGRMSVLVEAGEAGTYDLVSANVLTGKARDRVLGRAMVSGPVAAPANANPAFPQRSDLRQAAVTAARTLVFSDSADAERYFIDGRIYDHGRIDMRVPLGSVEEWTIRNDSDEMHVFHIHQVHFQIVAVDGHPAPFEGYRDTVKVPERGTVTVRIPFLRREMLGRFVFHCHVLKHEDKGMMANIEVYDPSGVRDERPAFRTWRAGLTGGAALPYQFCGP